jgi:TonB family protein
MNKSLTTGCWIGIFILHMAMNSTIAQDTIKSYLDLNLMNTQKDKAILSRVTFQRNNHYCITDRYMNGRIIKYGEYSSLDPLLEDGFFQFYNESGELSTSGSFVKGKITGEWIYYNNHNSITVNYGEVENYFMHREDSCDRNSGRIDPDNSSEETKNIITDIIKFISNNINIPARTRKEKKDVEITANFILDTDGYLKCPSISNSPNPDYDYETLRVLFLYHNKSIITQPVNLSIPVTFVSENEPIFIITEKTASFHGGDLTMFRNYVESIKIYPEEAIKAKIQGKVIVQFLINENGFLVDPKILRGIDPLLDNEVLRCLINSPVWQPAQQGGRNVQQQFVMPVSFVLDENTK